MMPPVYRPVVLGRRERGEEVSKGGLVGHQLPIYQTFADHSSND